MTAATPSRDSQEERHCLKARQARSGWPRCKVEDSKPMRHEAEADEEAHQAEPEIRSRAVIEADETQEASKP